MPIINMVYKKKQWWKSAYQEVEYIESSGTQYIDTNLDGKNDYSTQIAELEHLQNDQMWIKSDLFLFINQCK